MICQQLPASCSTFYLDTHTVENGPNKEFTSKILNGNRYPVVCISEDKPTKKHEWIKLCSFGGVYLWLRPCNNIELLPGIEKNSEAQESGVRAGYTSNFPSSTQAKWGSGFYSGGKSKYLENYDLKEPLFMVCTSYARNAIDAELIKQGCIKLFQWPGNYGNYKCKLWIRHIGNVEILVKNGLGSTK